MNNNSTIIIIIIFLLLLLLLFLLVIIIIIIIVKIVIIIITCQKSYSKVMVMGSSELLRGLWFKSLFVHFVDNFNNIVNSE